MLPKIWDETDYEDEIVQKVVHNLREISYKMYNKFFVRISFAFLTTSVITPTLIYKHPVFILRFLILHYVYMHRKIVYVFLTGITKIKRGKKCHQPLKSSLHDDDDDNNKSLHSTLQTEQIYKHGNIVFYIRRNTL